MRYSETDDMLAVMDEVKNIASMFEDQILINRKLLVIL